MVLEYRTLLNLRHRFNKADENENLSDFTYTNDYGGLLTSRTNACKEHFLTVKMGKLLALGDF